MTWEARAGRVVAGQPWPAMTHPFLLPPAPNVTCPQQPETRSTRNPFCGTSHWQVALQSRGGGGWGSQPHLARCRGARRPSASLEHKPLGSSDAGEPVLLLWPHLGLHPAHQEEGNLEIPAPGILQRHLCPQKGGPMAGLRVQGQALSQDPIKFSQEHGRAATVTLTFHLRT